MLYFNLDAILSVGYRVNSKQATDFRRWANSALRDYRLKGYTFNKNIIDTKTKEYQNLLDILGKTLVNNQLVDGQGQNIVELITTYANTWTTLLQHDEDRLNLPSAALHKTSLVLDYENVLNAINEHEIISGTDSQSSWEWRVKLVMAIVFIKIAIPHQLKFYNELSFFSKSGVLESFGSEDF